MPHCVIEHSADIDGLVLLKPVYDGTLASGLFDASGKDIKVRAIAYDNYKVGEMLASFIHVSLKILSGRSDEQKSMLSEAVLSELQQLAISDSSMTVEVLDIDRASYSKLIT